MSKSETKLIGLSEFIKQIKQDLLDSQAKDSTPLFAIEQVEVEMKVVAKKSEGGKAGLSLSILGWGADAGVNREAGKEDVQTVRVTLSPLINKEQILSKMTAEELDKIMKQAQVGVLKGGGSNKIPGM